MLDAAIKALVQMFTRPFRAVLLKSIALAIAFLIVLAVALYRLLAWLTGAGEAWAEGSLGAFAHAPLLFAAKLLIIAFSLGIVAGAIFLMPAVTALVAGFFADEIAETVEHTHYPLEPPGVRLPLTRAILEGVKTAALAVVIYVACAPFLLLAGFGAVLFFLATAYLLGREYFELAAMRFHPAGEAKMLRRQNRSMIFIAGMFIAGFVSIPIVNLATPLFGTAFMVHIHKRLMRGGRRELIEPRRSG
jgi:CysZ protein